MHYKFKLTFFMSQQQVLVEKYGMSLDIHVFLDILK